MATNPMQRKSRVSFLLGALLMTVILGALCIFLFLQLKGKIDEENAARQNMAKVCVLNQSVSSGQVITEDMITTKDVNRDMIPSNATSVLTTFQNFALQDKEGNDVYTLTRNNETSLYISIDNTEYRIEQEEETQNYYITRNNNKEYLELNSVPIVAKIDMNANTVLTTEFLSKMDSAVSDDVRTQEYNMFVLPMDLMTGDYIDIRLMLPSGQDYIVVSKKEVTIPVVDGVDSVDTIWLNMREDEILSVSSAIVEAYTIQGSKLYVTKYTEAGAQEAATPTYVPNAEVTRLIDSDPNIVSTAMAELSARYSEANTNLRNNSINSQINNAGTEGQTNLQTKMQESITNSQTNRRTYLDSLTGNTTQ